MEDQKCACGEESQVGCHGIRDNSVYDEYYCYDCYNKKKRNKNNDD